MTTDNTAPSSIRRSRGICSIEECNRVTHTKTLCQVHYRRTQRRGHPTDNQLLHATSPCGVPACSRRASATASYCAPHEKRHLDYGDPLATPVMGEGQIPCGYEGCSELMPWNRTLCYTHRKRAQNYGITDEHLLELQAKFHGLCHICRSNVAVAIDHDHACCAEVASGSRKRSCGKCVRGLLCSSCNFGLGRFKDCAESLERAADYLRSSMPSTDQSEEFSLSS